MITSKLNYVNMYQSHFSLLKKEKEKEMNRIFEAQLKVDPKEIEMKEKKG